MVKRVSVDAKTNHFLHPTTKNIYCPVIRQKSSVLHLDRTELLMRYKQRLTLGKELPYLITFLPLMMLTIPFWAWVRRRPERSYTLASVTEVDVVARSMPVVG